MSTALTDIKNETLTKVEKQISELQQSGGLNFPQKYSVGNALKSAWLILQETVDREKKPALQVCTKESIYLSLLDMTIQGLSASKKQGYFIVYGKKIQFSRSYHGTIAVTKRLEGVEDVVAQVVYEGDEFEFEIVMGVKRVTKHVQKVENINPEKIVAAYAIIIKENGNHYTDIMPMSMIKKSWSKTKMANNTVQKDFAEEMAKRTVINRACKHFVNTSDDSDLIIDSFDRSDEKSVDDAIGAEIDENANSEIFDADFTVVDDTETTSPETPPQPDPEAKPDF